MVILFQLPKLISLQTSFSYPIKERNDSLFLERKDHGTNERFFLCSSIDFISIVIPSVEGKTDKLDLFAIDIICPNKFLCKKLVM